MRVTLRFGKRYPHGKSSSDLYAAGGTYDVSDTMATEWLTKAEGITQAVPADDESEALLSRLEARQAEAELALQEVGIADWPATTESTGDDEPDQQPESEEDLIDG